MLIRKIDRHSFTKSPKPMAGAFYGLGERDPDSDKRPGVFFGGIGDQFDLPEICHESSKPEFGCDRHGIPAVWIRQLHDSERIAATALDLYLGTHGLT